ncbi:MucR family transcriptional regulator [Methylobacterium nigriterrae]|uniref:MucR family transcriptional regulator n=1 Tax=Methylobacterium nigriterrae TaxID=3127512 RepID=UPI00301340DF
MKEDPGVPSTIHVDVTAQIVSAYVSKNSVWAAHLPDLIVSVHAALSGLGKTAEPAGNVEKPTPAQITKSITPDALISFIDGKPYKTLKRHLTRHGLSMQEYRARYGLPVDYPATAPNFSARRSELARALGLGQQRRKSAGGSAPSSEPKGRRKPKVAGQAEA